MTRSGRPKKPERFITYRGETKTVKDWASEAQLTLRTFERRIAKFDAGDLSLDECFAATKAVGTLPGHAQTVGKVHGKGKRVRAIEALFDSFIAEGLPRIPNEMRHYMATGEIGNAMNFYIKYQSFFPREKLDSLDESVQKQVASVAVVFADKPPENITILDQ